LDNSKPFKVNSFAFIQPLSGHQKQMQTNRHPRRISLT